MTSFISQVNASSAGADLYFPPRVSYAPKHPGFCGIPVAGSGRDAGFLFTYQRSTPVLTKGHFGIDILSSPGKSPT